MAGNRRRRVVIAAILLLTVSQGMFAIRRSKDRENQRQAALAAVADERDAMRTDALREADAERREAVREARQESQRRRGTRPDEWFDNRSFTIVGSDVALGIVLLGGVWVAWTIRRQARRRRARSSAATDALNAPTPDWSRSPAARADARSAPVERS
jgi:preprotein translocase subunit YajC